MFQRDVETHTNCNSFIVFCIRRVTTWEIMADAGLNDSIYSSEHATPTNHCAFLLDGITADIAMCVIQS